MEKILASLKKKEYHPLYLLHGEEPYFIDVVSDFIEENVLTEADRAFNQMVLYGKECNARQVIDACSQFPMMASHRVIILKEAQEMRDIKNLESYVKSPAASTILCICYKHKKLDTRSAFGKALKNAAVVLEAKKMYDNQLPQYVNNVVQGAGRQIDPQAARMVSEYIGSDLSTLHNELEKLFLSIPQGQMITTDWVQKQIGISKDFNVFELQSAMATKDVEKAFRIARYFRDNPKKNPMIMVIATLYRFFSKVWVVAQNQGMNDQAIGKMIGVYNSFFMREYRAATRLYNSNQLERILSLLKEYDLKSKGVDNRSYPENQLLTELIGKMLL